LLNEIFYSGNDFLNQADLTRRSNIQGKELKDMIDWVAQVLNPVLIPKGFTSKVNSSSLHSLDVFLDGLYPVVSICLQGLEELRDEIFQFLLRSGL
jgi:hypothetical protein